MADTLTPNYSFVIQQPGTNRNTWGGKLNANWTSIDGLLFTASTNAASALAAANLALPRAGGTMTGDLVLADVAASSQRSAGFRGAPVISIDADRTFGSTDAGKMIRLFGATTRTWTIPNTSSVGFQPGTAIVLRNFSTGVPLNIVRAAGVALRTAGTTLDSNKSLATFGMATIVMEDNNIWVISGVGVS